MSKELVPFGQKFATDIYTKELELEKLEEQLEAAKTAIPDLEAQKTQFFAQLPPFMQHQIQGIWGMDGGEQQNSFESMYNRNPAFQDKWQNYQNTQQNIDNYKNQIAQLPAQIKAEKTNIRDLKKAETDYLKAENNKIKELQRAQEQLEAAKNEAEEFRKETQGLLEGSTALDPDLESYKNLKDTQSILEQNIQAAIDKYEKIKGVDTTIYERELNKNRIAPNENPPTPTEINDLKSNINSKADDKETDTLENGEETNTLEYYKDSVPILEKYPEFARQYNKNKLKDPRRALENLVQDAYDKDIANGDTNNLLEYRNILNGIEKENLNQDIFKREANARKKAEEANINPKTGKQYTEKERQAALEEMIGNKQEYPGADINNLTFHGKPIFYTNLLKNIALRTAQLTNPEKAYPYYTKPRIARPSKEETIAYDLFTQNLLKPEYEETYKNTLNDLKKLQGEFPTKKLQDADEIAAQKTTNENIEDYVNPKTNSVLDLIQKRALRNFQENIMPKVSAPFIARGSFNTGARAEAQERARRDLMEGLMDNETQFLASAYEKARDTASADKKIFLNYKLSKAGLEGDEIIKKGKIAEDTSKLMDTYHKNKLLDMEALRTVGQNQRDIKQRGLDLQYEEFKNITDYPLRQVEILNRMIHQLPVESLTGVSSRTIPTKNEQVSPWQTGAGILGQMAYMDKINKAEGGMIQRHAEGGMIDKMKDQYLQDLMTRAQNTEVKTQDPSAHYMLGLSNALASSRNPNAISALGEASTHGVGQFMNAKEYNRGLEDQSLGFKKSIVDYLDQAELRKQEKLLNDAKINEMNAKSATFSNFGNINGQVKAPVPASVQRIAAQTLKQLDSDAQIAKEENKLLDNSEKSLEQMKKATNSFTKPGSIVSKLANKYKILENLVYNEQAQQARQEIEKNNSLLIQNRAGPGTNPTDESRKIIASGMPRETIQPEASAEILISKRQQNTDKELRSKFIHEWAKQTGGNINGAQDAFNEFIRDKVLLNENGKPNYDIMKEIPSTVYNYITETPYNIDNEDDIDPSQYDDISDEAIIHQLESRQ